MVNRDREDQGTAIERILDSIPPEIRYRPSRAEVEERPVARREVQPTLFEMETSDGD